MLAVRDSELGKLLYTVEQTLGILGMSRSQLYREMARGALKGIRIGKARRFSRAELERYVEAQYAAEA